MAIRHYPVCRYVQLSSLNGCSGIRYWFNPYIYFVVRNSSVLFSVTITIYLASLGQMNMIMDVPLTKRSLQWYISIRPHAFFCTLFQTLKCWPYIYKRLEFVYHGVGGLPSTNRCYANAVWKLIWDFVYVSPLCSDWSHSFWPSRSSEF